MDFKKFKTAVASQFQRMQMSEQPLYRTQADKDSLWETYLTSFPEGSNPIYRVRAEYDCGCCRQFIKTVGNVVAIKDNELVSIWDITVDEPAFQTVANAMSALVKSKLIENAFLHTERVAGTDKNFEQITGGVHTWEHFFINIPKQFVMEKIKIGPALSEYKARHDVLLRSLTELTTDAIDTVLELIAQNSLYRGNEHEMMIKSFKNLKNEFDITRETLRDNFVWKQIKQVPSAISKIRNTAIGSLLIDLSEGIDLEEAVKKFESVVAPTNYKRPTALVTKAMVDKAKEKIEELGLTSALERRYACLSDISINDIIFADRSIKKNLAGSVFDDIAAAVPDKKPKYLDKVDEIPIDKFLADILPLASGVELMFENKHIKNLVSLIAPVDPTAGQLFKWNNNFSWAYNGDLADSIREKVKRAGGNVTGDLCCRFAWFNYDDLDLHMTEPDGHEIFFQNKGRMSRCGGMLDVDMNAVVGSTREPVENIYYQNRGSMKEGIYKLRVHQYTKRESENVGFEVEFDFMGDIKVFAYQKPVKDFIDIIEFKYSHKKGIEVISAMPSASVSKNVWNLLTGKYHNVNIIMLSPNHWENSGFTIGNKHYFFMLDGCANPDPARGFFNEFLKEELNAHRKVFEIAGSKIKTAQTPNQLSGLGFSSTLRNSILCKISGNFNRVINIKF